MSSYSIDEITRLIGAVRTGHTPGDVEWLLTDSRSLSFAETTLFFALRTRAGTGAAYVSELQNRGVRHFVVCRADADLLHSQGYALEGEDETGPVNLLWVDDSLAALQTLAARRRDRFGGTVIGITGSNGKTMVKEWLHQLLSPDHRVVRSPRSYNSQIGVPLSVWQIDDNRADIALIEAGISQPGEMQALQRIVRPDIGVFTNLGMAHQENFSTGREKGLEKLLLFATCPVTIYHRDDKLTSLCVGQAGLSDRSFAISRRDNSATLFVNSVDKEADHTRIVYTYQSLTHEYALPFIDEASIENSLTCLAVCLQVGMEPDVIGERLSRLEAVAMRLEVKEGERGCTLINDSYNSDLPSLDIALDFMQRRSARPDSATRRRTLILSDMEQTGLEKGELYTRVAEIVSRRGIDNFVGIGPELRSLAHCFATSRKSFYPTTDALLRDIDAGKLHFEDEIILIKGARRYGLEAVSERLEKKVHETILEVNLSALVANLNHYRSYLRPDTKMVCMVKASAYGAGALEVSRTLQEHRVDYLAVAVADEGVELRQAGITAHIIVMNPERTAFRALFDYQLEPEVYSFHLLDTLMRAAERCGVTHHPIHIKIDTGMHRLGFEPADMPALVDKLRGQDALTPRSVFSHLAGSDTAGLEAFTLQQIATFEQAAATLQASTPHRLLRHICNSAGITRFSDYQFEMVRLGLGLYGIDPFDNSTLNCVSTLRTTILQLRHVAAGDTVGYGRRGHIDRPSRIAVLPIGYADGLNRRLGNGRAYCLVDGKRAPYVGNICMDICMVDVTDIDCHEGDTVEIFGPNLPVTTLSDTLGTIPYEVLTGISTRVKRVYFSE